jgi:hypothetical protein
MTTPAQQLPCPAPAPTEAPFSATSSTWRAAIRRPVAWIDARIVERVTLTAPLDPFVGFRSESRSPASV